MCGMICNNTSPISVPNPKHIIHLRIDGLIISFESPFEKSFEMKTKKKNDGMLGIEIKRMLSDMFLRYESWWRY